MYEIHRVQPLLVLVATIEATIGYVAAGDAAVSNGNEEWQIAQSCRDTLGV